MYKEMKMSFMQAMEINKSSIENIAYKRYTKESSMTAVDPSLFWEKMVTENKRPKLSTKIPTKAETYYEYGYDNEGRCVYRKVITTQGTYKSTIDICFIYEGTSIYEIPSNIYEMPYCEYHYDSTGRIKEIYGREKYNWIYEDVAIIDKLVYTKDRWLLIQYKDELLALFELKKEKWKEHMPSLITGNDINLKKYKTINETKIYHPQLNATYRRILDSKEHPTEYYEICILDEKYIGSYFYIKPPKSFSYTRAKRLYKDEIINYMKERLNYMISDIKTITIQYFTNGYSILDVNFSFYNQADNKDERVTEIEEMIFSAENIEELSFLDTYINGNMYYGAHKKMMREIKRDIEETFQVKVFLEEVSD